MGGWLSHFNTSGLVFITFIGYSMRIDWTGVVVLVALIAGGLVATALGKGEVGSMLIAAGIGTLSPSPVRKQ